MFESLFPPEVPNIDEAIRVKPVMVDYVSRNYKFFCEESHVTSRFFAIDYADRKHVEVDLTGEKIRKIRFSLEYGTWWTHFDDKRIQLEVEKILD